MVRTGSYTFTAALTHAVWINPQQASITKVLTEPNHWIILLVSFLEIWRELGLVHPMVKNQLLVCAWGAQHSLLHTAWAVVFSSSFWVFYISTTLLVELIRKVQSPFLS